MGATHIPRKGTRTDFDLADDRILYDWVQQFEKTQDPLSGTKIYQDLAERVRTTDSTLQTSTLLIDTFSFHNTHGNHGVGGI